MTTRSLLCLALATVTALPLAGATDAAVRGNPVVIVTDRTPLTVQGFRFRRGERVTVLLRRTRLLAKKRVRAGRSGTFVARFPRLRLPCGRYVISAVGNRGTRVTILDVPPRCARVRP